MRTLSCCRPFADVRIARSAGPRVDRAAACRTTVGRPEERLRRAHGVCAQRGSTLGAEFQRGRRPRFDDSLFVPAVCPLVVAGRTGRRSTSVMSAPFIAGGRIQWWPARQRSVVGMPRPPEVSAGAFEEGLRVGRFPSAAGDLDDLIDAAGLEVVAARGCVSRAVVMDDDLDLADPDGPALVLGFDPRAGGQRGPGPGFLSARSADSPWMEVMPERPVANAQSIAIVSGPRHSPTRIRSGFIRMSRRSPGPRA